jgi:hypothetical protein
MENEEEEEYGKGERRHRKTGRKGGERVGRSKYTSKPEVE